jgi:antagonist of KipI
MSLKIIKSGLLTSLQDAGRRGFGHLGIRCCGPMDPFAAALAHALLANGGEEPLIEIHFPAGVFQFTEPALIVITGADFSPSIDGRPIPMGQPLIVPKNTVLEFQRPIAGVRCYLAVKGLNPPKWLGSASADLRSGVSGLLGRSLKSGDEISFTPWRTKTKKPVLIDWKEQHAFHSPVIRIIKGPEYDWLTEEGIRLLCAEKFTVSRLSDRMGSRLEGKSLEAKQKKELLSSALVNGTIQLLPSGQLVILMADHGTTGGYPRIAHVCTADLGLVAQAPPGSQLQFKIIEKQEAAAVSLARFEYLETLRKMARESLDLYH